MFRGDSFLGRYRPDGRWFPLMGKVLPLCLFVAHVHPYVVGVDTHARHHVYSVLVSSTGELLGSQKFPTTEAGLKRAMRRVVHRTRSHVKALWVIEGTSSYGAVLTGMVLASDFSVAEAPRVDSQHRAGVGKTDELDSARIARAALGLPVDKLRRPRLGKGIRQAIPGLLPIYSRWGLSPSLLQKFRVS